LTRLGCQQSAEQPYDSWRNAKFFARPQERSREIAAERNKLRFLNFLGNLYEERLLRLKANLELRMSERRYDPQRWFQQAEEARRIVKYMGEPYARLQMLTIAEAYSHLGQHALDLAELKMKSGIAN
jgi:hypothetical protein